MTHESESEGGPPNQDYKKHIHHFGSDFRVFLRRRSIARVYVFEKYFLSSFHVAMDFLKYYGFEYFSVRGTQGKSPNFKII